MDRVLIETRNEEGIWTLRGEHWIEENSTLCSIEKTGTPFNSSSGAANILKKLNQSKIAYIHLPELRKLNFNPIMVREFEIIALKYKTTCDKCLRVIFIEH